MQNSGNTAKSETTILVLNRKSYKDTYDSVLPEVWWVALLGGVLWKLPFEEKYWVDCVYSVILSLYSETSLEDHPYSKTALLKDHTCVTKIAF
jgi:hypothetical protein